MALATEKLRILTFPQHIEGNQLDLNVLLLPTQALLNEESSFDSQLNPGTTVQLPKFILADLKLQVITIKGLSSYPFSSAAVLNAEGASSDPFPTGVSFPANLPALYEGLAAQFTIDTASKPLSGKTSTGVGDPGSDGIRKYLPQSYRAAFNFTRPRTEFAVTDDSYRCAIERTPDANPAFQQSADNITWGRVIAFCLRQPLLAESIGLLHHVSINLPTPNYFENGGWVYFDLISALADFDITDRDKELRQYSARIPIVDRPRHLFAALVFPVVPGPAQPNGQFDILKVEASDYDDGFAKIVHAVQPVSANLLSEGPD